MTQEPQEPLTEEVQTRKLMLKDEFLTLEEGKAEELAEKELIVCDFDNNEPVVVKVDEEEQFRAYSYQGLLKGFMNLSGYTVTLYIVDEEEQEEEAFLKVELWREDINQKATTEATTEATTAPQEPQTEETSLQVS